MKNAFLVWMTMIVGLGFVGFSWPEAIAPMLRVIGDFGPTVVG